MVDEQYDVLVVGGSIAGCTTAILFARARLRVALLEAEPDMAAYQRRCTGYVQGSATPVLERLALAADLDASGAVHNVADFWTSYGWTREPDKLAGCPAFGYSVRRSVLDPLLRRTAAAEPMLDLLLGARVHGLVRDESGRVDGVVASVDGRDRVLRSRLVVGADGRGSGVAEMAGLRARVVPNQRSSCFAAYRHVSLPHSPRAKIWLLDDGTVVGAYPTDDGVTVLSVMAWGPRFAEFEQRPERALLMAYDGLPDGPDLLDAERVGEVVVTGDCSHVRRDRAATPGVALVGDAAMAGDPVWAVGCGWALQSAAWLVDATAPTLLAGGNVDRAAARYATTHRRNLRPHFDATAEFSSRRPFRGMERLVFAGAPYDALVAQAFWRYLTRNAPPKTLRAPSVLTRASMARSSSTRVHQPQRQPCERSKHSEVG